VAVGEKRVQTKEDYKLRLTTKAYKLSYSYNYINGTINLVDRSFGKWRHRRLRSGGSRRVRRMSFGFPIEASTVMGAVVANFFLN
jgi:hypothetical protein